MSRNQQILALRGQKSYGLIAKELDLTRNVVAGVVFRNTHPIKIRYPASDGRRNKTGVGHHGPGPYAGETLFRRPGARMRIPLAQLPQAPAALIGAVPAEAIDLIQIVCAQGFLVAVRALRGRSRQQRIVHARHVAMALAHELSVYSLPEIGRRFGRRDHTTVRYAVRKIEALEAADETLRLEMDLLRAAIAGAPA